MITKTVSEMSNYDGPLYVSEDIFVVPDETGNTIELTSTNVWLDLSGVRDKINIIADNSINIHLKSEGAVRAIRLLRGTSSYHYVVFRNFNFYFEDTIDLFYAGAVTGTFENCIFNISFSDDYNPSDVRFCNPNTKFIGLNMVNCIIFNVTSEILHIDINNPVYISNYFYGKINISSSPIYAPMIFEYNICRRGFRFENTLLAIIRNNYIEYEYNPTTPEPFMYFHTNRPDFTYFVDNFIEIKKLDEEGKFRTFNLNNDTPIDFIEVSDIYTSKYVLIFANNFITGVEGTSQDIIRIKGSSGSWTIFNQNSEDFTDITKPPYVALFPKNANTLECYPAVVFYDKKYLIKELQKVNFNVVANENGYYRVTTAWIGYSNKLGTFYALDKDTNIVYTYKGYYTFTGGDDVRVYIFDYNLHEFGSDTAVSFVFEDYGRSYEIDSILGSEIVGDKILYTIKLKHPISDEFLLDGCDIFAKPMIISNTNSINNITGNLDSTRQKITCDYNLWYGKLKDVWIYFNNEYYEVDNIESIEKAEEPGSYNTVITLKDSINVLDNTIIFSFIFVKSEYKLLKVKDVNETSDYKIIYDSLNNQVTFKVSNNYDNQKLFEDTINMNKYLYLHRRIEDSFSAGLIYSNISQESYKTVYTTGYSNKYNVDSTHAGFIDYMHDLIPAETKFELIKNPDFHDFQTVGRPADIALDESGEPVEANYPLEIFVRKDVEYGSKPLIGKFELPEEKDVIKGVQYDAPEYRKTGKFDVTKYITDITFRGLNQ